MGVFVKREKSKREVIRGGMSWEPRTETSVGGGIGTDGDGWNRSLVEGI